MGIDIPEWALPVLLGAVLSGIGFTLWKGIAALLRNRAAPRFRERDADWVIEKRKWSWEGLLQRLIALDKICLSGLTDASAGNEKTKAPVFAKSPETWRLIVMDDVQIVAYWSCFSLSDRLVAKIEAGKMFDSEINEREVKSLSEGGSHSLYFEMICIHPDYRINHNNTIMILLFNSLKKFGENLKEAGILVGGVYADGYSADGEKLCKNFGMARTVKSDQGGYVYKATSFDSILARLKLFSKRSLAKLTI